MFQTKKISPSLGHSVLRKVLWAIIIVWMVIPFIPLFLWSFAENWWFPSIFPASISFRAWEYLLRPNGRFVQAFANSTWIAMCSSLCSLLLGIPVARYVGNMKAQRREHYRVAFSLPLVLPPLALAFGLHILFIHLSIAETFWGVIIAHILITLPYVLYILTGIFSNIHPDYEAQARSLGARRLQVFCFVRLRLAIKGILVAGMIGFLISWHQYILTLIIGGGRVATLPTLLFSFIRSGDLTLVGAAAVLFFLPPTVLFFIASLLIGAK